MKICLDIGTAQLKKTGEELCGDTIEIQYTEDTTIIVLSDGLGSGVKANILSQITAKTAGTMLKKGGKIDEVIDTLVYTLPTCQKRNLAYSTFTIIQIFKDGQTYIANFDNPQIFWGKKGVISTPHNIIRNINEKRIIESYFTLKNGDWLVSVSDGVLHAGIGNIWNMGWGWERISQYLAENTPETKNAKEWANEIARVCTYMYGGTPKDDASIAVVKARAPRRVTILIGPPKNIQYDSIVVNKLINSDGQKVVCGGTTGNIVGRELGKEVKVDLNSNYGNVPPMGVLPGIDLITEGTLTLLYTLENLRQEDINVKDLASSKDGASKLTTMLLDADSIEFIIGTAINPAQLSPEVPAIFAYKQQIIKDIMEILKNMGKSISHEYY